MTMELSVAFIAIILFMLFFSFVFTSETLKPVTQPIVNIFQQAYDWLYDGFDHIFFPKKND